MKWGRSFLLAALLTTTALPSKAAPVAAAVTAISTFAASSAIASFVVQVALATGLTLLQGALAKKGAQRSPGIQTEVRRQAGPRRASS